MLSIPRHPRVVCADTERKLAHVGNIYRDLDHLQIIYILTCHCEMLCRICIVQIQPMKHVLHFAHYMAPTRQHELDHTDQEYICPARQIIQIRDTSALPGRSYRSGTHLPCLADHTDHDVGIDHTDHDVGIDHTDHDVGIDHTDHDVGIDHTNHDVGIDHTDHLSEMWKLRCIEYQNRIDYKCLDVTVS